MISAEICLYGSDNLTSSALESSPDVDSSRVPISLDYQPQIEFEGDVTLGTHRQEKDSFRGAPHGHAGFTCPMCPIPWRRLEGGALGEQTYDVDGKPVQYRKWLNTKRCKTCNNSMKRWQRAKALNERVHNAHAFFEDSVLAFVTLTKPNVPDLPGRGTLAEEARLMKKQVANFRRGKRMKRIVLGGIDVVENTIAQDGSWNIHHHGIWVMNGYYSQRDLDQDWGLGRVHIEKVRKPHATIRYLTSYVSKEPIAGVRCLETFTALRGSAYAVIDDYLASQKECDDVGHASDEAGSTGHLNS